MMKDKNGGKPVDERHLFHGTEESLLDPICEQNFDWRMCGVHGTAYGKGTVYVRLVHLPTTISFNAAPS
jgi:poly [ADP-ribose] polymerase 7/11/12/13